MNKKLALVDSFVHCCSWSRHIVFFFFYLYISQPSLLFFLAISHSIFVSKQKQNHFLILSTFNDACKRIHLAIFFWFSIIVLSTDCHFIILWTVKTITNKRKQRSKANKKKKQENRNKVIFTFLLSIWSVRLTIVSCAWAHATVIYSHWIVLIARELSLVCLCKHF